MSKRCQVCGSRSCLQILDLGKQPICNKFISSKTEFGSERLYPLDLVFCRKCKLVQLSYVPPAREVFAKNFNYLSGTDPDRVAYFGELAKHIIHKFDLKADDFVLDIGSNDGSLLKQFKNNGVNAVLGIDPAPKPCKIANSFGVTTINSKFEHGIEPILAKTGNKIKVIMALNVLAHTDTIHTFLNGIKKLLAGNEATFVSISHYLQDMIENNEYDTIYHEHARYYSLASLSYLFSKYGLYIYDAEKISLYGGSILVYAKNHRIKKTDRLKSLMKKERNLQNIKAYRKFSNTVIKNRAILLKILSNLKRENKTIVGIGAPMKSSTLLNYCKIDNKTLKYVTELNQLKIGTYTPGTHIKVVEESSIFKDKPDACLILSWNASSRIIRTFKSRGYRGIFIIPIPKVKIVR